MRIVYTTRFRDLWRFNAVHQLRSLAVQVYFVGISALLTWASVLGSSCGKRGSCLTVGVIFFVLVYFVVVAAQFLFNAAFLYARNNRSVLTEHRIEIKEDGVYEETAYNRSLFLWPGIHKTVSAAGFFAIYVTAHSALLVPDSAFVSAEQRQEFIGAIKGKLNAI
jgi:hypothetical protein